MKLDELSPNIHMYWAQTKITPVYTYTMERGGTSDAIYSLNSTQTATVHDATQLIDKVHAHILLLYYYICTTPL
jgi:hypothetical protein